MPRAKQRAGTGAGAMDGYEQGRDAGEPPPAPRTGTAEPPRTGTAEPPRTGSAAPPPRTGIAALSPPYRIAAALALAVVALVACVHLAMIFLHVAPANTVSKQHGEAVDDWVYPEFEQNWKLFAPNPLQQNIAVEARAQFRTEDGGVRHTEWHSLSAQDGAAIDGNLLPSHTDQNQLRRAWDYYTSTHDTQNRPNGMRGELSEEYLRRIAVLRIGREEPARAADGLLRVQVRSVTTNVQPPSWSGEKLDPKPVIRLLPWWNVTSQDMEVRDR
ncbi:DUF5819 family protein [Streptomyces sp. B-S-A8]|uniref:DUF5819 family protein n=1 Tax=Streptomyces solicavernae TaxID=3043614 RepID=A0ABT6RK29_9ACTN|nr:DUF5819 family protein [Streptomyces sp. B-S-A8]MDI3384782.1 DUF5819 family protein [Streptomyces sp. B-S-A8]